jgi:hypothetical protein
MPSTLQRCAHPAPRATDPATPEDKRANPYQILSRQQPRVPPDLAESRQFNIVIQQHCAGATVCGALLLKTSKTMWMRDITSMSACPLVCRTGQQRPQELYYSMCTTNNQLTGQDRHAQALPATDTSVTHLTMF